MPNIFQGLNKLSDEEIIDKIAMLEAANVKNFSKPLAQNVEKSIVKAINYIGEKIGKNPNIKEVEVKKVPDLMNEIRNSLKFEKRDEINRRFQQDLKKKLNLSDYNISDDMLSAQVIKEAARLFKLDDSFTVSNKADYIFKQLDNSQEREKFLSHFDSYKSIFGTNKLKKEMLCYIVYYSVLGYGSPFTVSSKLVPSYIDGEEEENRKKVDEEYFVFKNNVLDLKDKANFYKSKIDELNNDIINKNYNIEKDKKIVEDSEFKIAELNREKIDVIKEIDNLTAEIQKYKNDHEISDDTMNIIPKECRRNLEKKEDELDDLYDELQTLNEDIDAELKKIHDTNEEIPETEDNIKKIESNIEDISKDYNKALEIYEKENYKFIIEEDKRKNSIKEKWQHFSKCNFHDTALINATSLRLNEIYTIEKTIMELEDCTDSKSVSVGGITYNEVLYDNIKVKISKNKVASIVYKAPKKADEKIEVAEIIIKEC